MLVLCEYVAKTARETTGCLLPQQKLRWLLVVLVLEIDVRLQERHRLKGVALRMSNLSKYILYSTLLLAAIYWGIKGDFVDFWDAFLWLVAFVFIEHVGFEFCY